MTNKRWRVEDVSCERPDLPPPTRTQDTGGVDDKQSSNPYDLRQAGDFVEVWGAQVLDRWRGGIIEITAAVTEDAAGVGVTYQYSLIEFRVCGYIGSAVNYLRRGAIAGSSGPVPHVIDDLQAFTRISVEARKIVDGQPGSAIAPTVLQAHVIARFIRA